MAVSPIDGRYRNSTRALAANPAIDAFKPVDDATAQRLRTLYKDFTLADARRVKEFEAETNHDVKAVEYFLKERIAALDSHLPLEMVHFACTSEDINNLAYALILKEFTERELIPALGWIVADLTRLARRFKDVAMVARTHGQEASPTTVGKEFAIFVHRLVRQVGHLGRQD